MHGLDAIVLDCDGILLETVRVKTEAFGVVGAPWGTEASRAFMAYHTAHGGVSRTAKVVWFLEEYLKEQPTPQRVAELSEAFGQACREGAWNADKVPGAVEFLKAASGRWPLYVASGTPQEELREMLRHHGLAGYFVEIYGTLPEKPELLARAVRHANARPQRTVMVGDSDTDYTAALAVGTLFYGRGERFAACAQPWGEDLTGLLAHCEALERG